MPSFVRKNLITISASCKVPGQPISDQPTTGVAVLSFKSVSNRWTVVTLALTNGGTPNYLWTATWDSSAAMEGIVLWVVYFSGGVQAAQEGSFSISANRANVF